MCLCDDECESVVHVLWECPAYKDSREDFMIKLRSILGEAFKDFKALDNWLAGASQPSRSTGAVLISIRRHWHCVLAPTWPRATRKRKAGSIISGCLVSCASTSICSGIMTHESCYP